MIKEQPSLNPIFYIRRIPMYVPVICFIVAQIRNLSFSGFIIYFVALNSLWVCVDMILSIAPYLKKISE